MGACCARQPVPDGGHGPTVGVVLDSTLLKFEGVPTAYPGAPSDDYKLTSSVQCAAVCGVFTSALRAQAARVADFPDTSSERAVWVCKWLSGPAAALHPFQLLPTASATEVFDKLVTLSAKLVDNRFSGHDHGHSRVFVGARGAGKSMSLRRFLVAGPVVFEKLRVVYIDASTFSGGSLFSEVQSLDLRSAPLAVEAASGFAESKTGDAAISTGTTDEECKSVAPPAAFDGMKKHLTKQGLYLMVIVDEMEHLFETSTPTSFRILDEIRLMSSQNTGRVSVIGCSSTSFMPGLLRGGGSLPDTIRAQFRVFSSTGDRVQTDMNGQKFQVCDIAQPSPVSSDAVAHFCVTPRILSHQRIVAFVRGTNARRLYNSRELASGDLELAPLMEFAVSPAKKEVPDAHAVLDALYTLLVIKNSKVLARCLKGHSADARLRTGAFQCELADLDSDAIGSIDWDVDFFPITVPEVDAVRRAWFAEMPPARMEEIIRFLEIDAALVTRINGCVYPWSVLALCRHANYHYYQGYHMSDVMNFVSLKTLMSVKNTVLRVLLDTGLQKQALQGLLSLFMIWRSK